MTLDRPVLLRRHVTARKMRKVSLDKHVPTMVAMTRAKWRTEARSRKAST